MHLHYCASFQVVPKGSQKDAWDKIVRLIRTWIVRKAGHNEGLIKKWFFEGGTWNPRKGTGFSVRTEILPSSTPGSIPDCWGVRVEHSDAEEKNRRWRTEITVSVTSAGSLVFHISVFHMLRAGYMGAEPKAPLASAPSIVADILKCADWTSLAGTQELKASPIELHANEADRLKAELASRERLCPIVVVSRVFQSGNFLTNPTQLARVLAGVAVVYRSADSKVDKALESTLGRDFSCWNGSVRVYLPEVKFDSSTDAARHRYFTQSDLQGMQPGVLDEWIVNGIVRRAQSRLRPPLVTLDDICARRATQRIQALKATGGQPSAEWVALLESTNVELEKHKKELMAQVDGLTESLQERDEQLAGLQDSLRRTEGERSMAYSQMSTLKNERDALKDRLMALDTLKELPNSVSEILTAIERLFPDKLYFTDKAKKAAREATLRKPEMAWRCLWQMATSLHDMHFQEKLTLREIINRFRSTTPFDLAVGESETTGSNKKLASARRDFYKGAEIDISPHVKWGRSAPDCLRVHYYVDPQDKILVIGHCGDHLDTIKTN